MSRRDRRPGRAGDDARRPGAPQSGHELFGGHHTYGGMPPHDRTHGGYDGQDPRVWADPAYAAQVHRPADPGYDPTRVLPTAGPGGGRRDDDRERRDDVAAVSGSPRWLWALAGLAVVFVVGLAVALVIVTSNSQQETLVAPALSPASSTPTSTRARPVVPPSTTPGRPTTTSPQTTPSTTGVTPGTAPADGTAETVTYQVDGTGRAISITYSDADSMLQTEFNVPLPWTRTVSLPAPAASSASVTIFNVSNEVTCTVTVDGAQVRRLTGVGLTSCNPLT